MLVKVCIDAWFNCAVLVTSIIHIMCQKTLLKLHLDWKLLQIWLVGLKCYMGGNLGLRCLQFQVTST